MENAVHLHVSGEVQGVGYRYWAQSTAARLGLRGWVRNLDDGRVELLAAGPAAVLDQFVDDCRMGPGAAKVEEVVVRDIEAPSLLSSFQIHA